MDKRIFKKCPTLGEYHGMALPYVKSQKEYMLFYKQHKEMIHMEAKVYSEINESRKKLGGDKRIHKIKTNDSNISA